LSLQPPDLIKLDVEGGEYNILKGFSETIEKYNPRVIFCEVHPSKLEAFGHDEGDVFEFFSKKGYEVKILREGEKESNYCIKATT